MGGENIREQLDGTMSELKERLRVVSENLSKARETNNAASSEKVEPPRRAPSPVKAASPSRLPAGAWPEHLKRLAVKLDAISSGTESEFLEIGSHLHEFQHKADKISETSGYVARLITSKEIKSDIVELEWILGRMKEWLAEAPSAGAQPHHHVYANMVVEKSSVCLGSLQKKHNMSAYMLREFSTKSDEMARSIGFVVRSLQYNDITRQHMEHARKEVESLSSRMRKEVAGQTVSGLAAFREQAAEAGQICSRQAAYLTMAKDEFDAAVKSITDNLLLVAKDASGMAEEISKVTRSDGDEGKSFLSSMGNWLGELAGTLKKFDPGSHASHGVPAEFERMVEELGVIVDSLRKLNGNILCKLSLMDDDGKGLSEDIQMAVRKFGHDTRVSCMTEEVIAGLEAVSAEARAIAPGAARLSDGRDFNTPPSGKCRVRDGGHENKKTDAGLGDNVELF